MTRPDRPPPPPPPAVVYMTQAAAPPRRGSGLGVASMVCGIVAIALAALPILSVLGVVLGLVAVGLSIPAMDPKAPNRGFAYTGLILGGLASIGAIALAYYI